MTWNRCMNLIDVVAEHFGLTRDDLLGRSRRLTVSVARIVAMRIARTEGYSYPELGIVFGRDHTTVMAVCRPKAGRSAPARLARVELELALCRVSWAARKRELYPPPAPAPVRVRVAVAERVA